MPLLLSSVLVGGTGVSHVRAFSHGRDATMAYMVGLDAIFAICFGLLGALVGFRWGLHVNCFVAGLGGIGGFTIGIVVGALFYAGVDRVTALGERLSPRNPLLWLLTLALVAAVLAAIASVIWLLRWVG